MPIPDVPGLGFRLRPATGTGPSDGRAHSKVTRRPTLMAGLAGVVGTAAGLPFQGEHRCSHGGVHAGPAQSVLCGASLHDAPRERGYADPCVDRPSKPAGAYLTPSVRYMGIYPGPLPSRPCVSRTSQPRSGGASPPVKESPIAWLHGLQWAPYAGHAAVIGPQGALGEKPAASPIGGTASGGPVATREGASAAHGAGGAGPPYHLGIPGTRPQDPSTGQARSLVPQGAGVMAGLTARPCFTKRAAVTVQPKGLASSCERRRVPRRQTCSNGPQGGGAASQSELQPG